MTLAEWAKCGALVNRLWPRAEWSRGTVDAGYRLVEDLPATQVLVAIEALAAEGTEFPPNPGQVRAKVVELDSPGDTWGEVWRNVQENITRYGHNRLPQDMPWLNATVAELVQLVGWLELCTAPDQDTTWQAQCRTKYEALVRRQQQEAAYSGLPDASLKRLVQARHRSQLTKLGQIAAQELPTHEG